jgi:hypothetical protein
MPTIDSIRLFTALRMLLRLPDKSRLDSGELEKAKGWMRELRGLGFTNREVSQLTRGRWSESTVKKYTRGTSLKSSDVKDRALSMVTELAEADKTVKDVEGYHQFNQIVEGSGVNLQIFAEFYSNIMKQKINLQKLLWLQDELEDSGRSLEELCSALDKEKELTSKDLTVENMTMMMETTLKYGGFENTGRPLKNMTALFKLTTFIF